MTGRASMHGAVTIINATATGRGASLGVRGGVDATWDWGGSTVTLEPADMDDRLAQSVHAVLQMELKRNDGARITTQSARPAARGLKTSSAAAAAMLQAGARNAGGELTRERLEALSVMASRDAGVTLTGAYDDQVAVVRGGCHLTDNRKLTVLADTPVEPWTVALWIPDVHIDKSSIAGLDASVIRSDIERAEAHLRAGDLLAAMQTNGDAFTRFYAAAGLPVSREPSDAAKEAGALAAGLSGTGPAVAAIFPPRSKPTIRPIEGGTWEFTQAVPA